MSCGFAGRKIVYKKAIEGKLRLLEDAGSCYYCACLLRVMWLPDKLEFLRAMVNKTKLCLCGHLNPKTKFILVVTTDISSLINSGKEK